MNIEFRNVGRDKRTWTADINTSGVPAALRRQLYTEVRANGGLMSRDLDVIFDAETFEGEIIVGGFRTVGTFGPAPIEEELSIPSKFDPTVPGDCG